MVGFQRSYSRLSTYHFFQNGVEPPECTSVIFPHAAPPLLPLL